MFQCDICEFQSRHFRVYTAHFRRVHLPLQQIKCPEQNCYQRFTSVRTLCKHLNRKHLDFFLQHVNIIQRDGAHNQQNDIDNESDHENGSASDTESLNENNDNGEHEHFNGTPISIKQIVASKLLAIREKHKVPSTVVSTVASEISTLVDLAHNEVCDKIQNSLQGQGVAVNNELREIFHERPEVTVCCDDLDSQKK